MKKFINTCILGLLLVLTPSVSNANDTDVAKTFVKTFYNSVIDVCYENTEDCVIASLATQKAVDTLIENYNLEELPNNVVHEWKKTSSYFCELACQAGRVNNKEKKDNLKKIVELGLEIDNETNNY